MFRITLPDNYPSPYRSWKYDSNDRVKTVAVTIAFLNAANGTAITQLPEGTKVVKF